jgi:8-oxo-dGTP diphosphatase
VLFEDGLIAMPAIFSEKDVPYLPSPAVADLLITQTTSPIRLTPTAFVLPFMEDGRAVFAVNLLRGPECAGGHIDPGETPEEAARREGLEEIGAILGDLYPVAAIRCLSRGSPDAAYLGKYPFPLSYMQFFTARVLSLVERTMPLECGPPLLLTDEEVETGNHFRSHNVRHIHNAARDFWANKAASHPVF